MKRPSFVPVPALLALLSLCGSAASVASARAATVPLGTAFTYQGELATGSAPANGTFDVRFRLYDAASGGTQLGTTLCSDNLVVGEGRFAVSLDFGAAFSGQKGYLEIEVRPDTGLDCTNTTGYTILSPRQELTPAPNAAYSLTASNALTLNGQAPAFYQNAANLTGTLPNSRLSGSYTSVLTLSNASNSFSGSGTGLTALNATNISTGTLAAARVGNLDASKITTGVFGAARIPDLDAGKITTGTLGTARMPTTWAAGGDLSGFFPAPTLRDGAVTLSKLSTDVQASLSQFTGLPATIEPAGAVGWGGQGSNAAAVPALPDGLAYTAIAGGFLGGAALRSDGSVVGWGRSNVGQNNVPALPAGTTYTSVAAGGDFRLALRSDGIAVGWGDNSDGETTFPALPAGTTYTKLAAGLGHTLALRSDGTLLAFGFNDSGQTLVPALPGGLTYTAIGAGASHSLAIRSDGSAVAWGLNDSGQATVPALPAGVRYTTVSGGEAHSVALRSDGMVMAWGDNTYGQTNVPALPAGMTYRAVQAGNSHTVAFRSDGTVIAWGQSASGQLAVPAVPSGFRYSGIGAGYVTSFALFERILLPSLASTLGLSVGTTSRPPGAGGLNVAGASTFSSGITAASFIGSGAALTTLSASSVTTGTLNASRLPANWAAGGDLTGFLPSPAVAAGAITLSKLSPDVQTAISRFSAQPASLLPGAPIGWGDNFAGAATFPATPSGVTYIAIAAGANHNVALRSDGTITTWGSNDNGALDGLPGLPAGITYTAVAASQNSSIALRSNGTVVGWGGNFQNQNASIPALPAGRTYTKVAVIGGTGTGVALRSDGNVVAWGGSQYGTLNVPALPAGVTYTSVSGGIIHALALRSDGTAVGWGYNGTGETNVPSLPVGLRYTAVAAASDFSIGLRSDGSVVQWGNFAIAVPTLPTGLTYTAIAAGDEHVCALRSDGAIVAWGFSMGFGELNVPALTAAARYTAVAAGGSHCLALVAQSIAPSISSPLGISVGTASAQTLLQVEGSGTFRDGHVAYFHNTDGNGSGIAIQIDKAHTTARNNFATFYNGSGTVVGRIEGFDLESGDWISPPPLSAAIAGGFASMRINTGITARPVSDWFSPGRVPSAGLNGGSLPSLSINFGTADFNFNRGSFPSLNFDPGALPSVSSPLSFSTPSIDFPLPTVDDMRAQLDWALNYNLPSLISASPLDVAVAAATIAATQLSKDEGVTYGSKGADYAEYLLKINPNEHINFGEVVGVFGGKVSRKTIGAERVMIISRAPAVVGNQPPDAERAAYEMVAFMGQVPVAVLGGAKVGDFIAASGNENGYAVAIHPEDLRPEHMERIVGRAWANSTDGRFDFINVHIGAKEEAAAMLLDREIKANAALKATGEVLRADTTALKALAGELKAENEDVRARLARLEQLLGQQ